MWHDAAKCLSGGGVAHFLLLWMVWWDGKQDATGTVAPSKVVLVMKAEMKMAFRALLLVMGVAAVGAASKCSSRNGGRGADLPDEDAAVRPPGKCIQFSLSVFNWQPGMAI